MSWYNDRYWVSAAVSPVLFSATEFSGLVGGSLLSLFMQHVSQKDFQLLIPSRYFSFEVKSTTDWWEIQILLPSIYHLCYYPFIKERMTNNTYFFLGMYMLLYSFFLHSSNLEFLWKIWGGTVDPVWPAPGSLSRQTPRGITSRANIAIFLLIFNFWYHNYWTRGSKAELLAHPT